MKYLIHYTDNAKDIDYREAVEYNGPVEDLLKELCEKHEARYQRTMKGLSEKAPELFTYTGRKAYRFEVFGNMAQIYVIEDNINVMNITAQPVE